MPRLVATCVWMVSRELIEALDNQFGSPVDSYVNGSQVWLRDDGPGDITVEWRLHPVAGYERPEGLGVHDVFDRTALALALGDEPSQPPEALWDGLEAFAAYGDEVEPAILAACCTAALGIAPVASGLVDHVRVGDEWERTGGKVSTVSALLSQLRD